MKIFYLFLLMMMNVAILQAQTTLAPTAAGCDTLNFHKLGTWGDTLIYYSGNRGLIMGTNSFKDLEFAQFFDLTGSSDAYITKVWIKFGVASSKTDAIRIPVSVYADSLQEADSTFLPGAAIAVDSSLTVATVRANVAGGNYTEVIFNPAIPIPASKRFYLGVDVSRLAWSKKDSVGIVSSDLGKGEDAWSRDDKSWTKQTPGGFNMGLYIHPFTSENKTCGVMPVNLLTFNAQAKGSSALLNWVVAQESNMKQYVIERAMQDQRFTAVGTVAATNTTLQHSYAYTDADALNSGSLLYYRIRQVDNDGKANYSKIISLAPTTSSLSIKVVNPFKNAVQLLINAPFVQKLQGGIYDMQGRRIVTAKELVLSQGQNSVSIPTGSLPKGVYILNLTAGKTQYKYKIVN